MIVEAQAKDPSEVRDYSFDWSGRLTSPETIASVVASYVDAAGTTQPVAATLSGGITRVWLAGGNVGSRVIFTVAVTTNSTPARTLEEAFGVDIVDTTTDATTADTLRADIATLEAAQMDLASGKMVREVVRAGRRLTYSAITPQYLESLICLKRQKLAEAEAVADGRPRRRAIALAWKN